MVQILKPVEYTARRNPEIAFDRFAQKRIQRKIKKGTFCASGRNRSFLPQTFGNRAVLPGRNLHRPGVLVYVNAQNIFGITEKTFCVEKTCGKLVKMMPGAQKRHHLFAVQIQSDRPFPDNPLRLFELLAAPVIYADHGRTKLPDI
jgi:hypothetical protein